MAVICGVVGADIAPERKDVLDGVLAVFEPHGTHSSSRSLRVGRRTAVLAGRRFDDESTNLAVQRGFDDAAADRAGITVVADVRLDHRDELAESVGLPSSSTDTELVLAAYLRWGERCLDRLYGDFAIAIADPDRGGLLLARDHAGHRPLVIHERPGLVAFATTALALTALDGVGHRLDTERLSEIVALAYGSERTLVEGVHFVQAGTAVWIDGDGKRTWRWWNPDLDRIEDLGSLEAHAEALRAAFDAAVASQLRTHGHTGVMLSGGLDSTSVAATAAPMMSPESLRTYTSVPSRGFVDHPESPTDADERHLVDELAGRYPNIKTAFIDVAGRGAFEHHEALWELGSGPLRNTMNTMWVFAINEEAAADGVTALLTGAFGNASFSADGPRWLIELARRGRLFRTFDELRAWSQAHDTSAWSVVRSDLAGPAAPRWARRLRNRQQQRPDRIGHWLTGTAIRGNRASELDLVNLLPTMNDADASRWTRMPFTMVAGGASQAESKAAFRAWWGIESRDPTSERRLLEHTLTQPEWWRRTGGVDRAIVRAAMADRLPPNIVERTTRGAQLPDWFDRLTESRTEVEEQLEQLRDHPTSRDTIDVDRLDTLVKNWPERDDAFSGEATRGYRLALPRALMVSRYVRWFEDRARRVASGGPAVVVPER